MSLTRCMRDICNSIEYVPTSQFVKLVFNGEQIIKEDSANFYLCQKCFNEFNAIYNQRCKENKEKPNRENSTFKNAVKISHNEEVLITYDFAKKLLGYLSAKPSQKSKNQNPLFGD